MSHPLQLPQSRRQVSSGSSADLGSQQDELHMPGVAASPHEQMPSPRDYAPQINPPQSANHSVQTQHHHHQQHASSGAPNVPQQSGLSARPPAVTASTAPVLPTMHSTMPPPSSGPPSQQQNQHGHQQSPASHEYQAPSKPSLSMPHSHSYSRSSPAAGFEPSTSYHAYTPTTPGGPSHLMSPSDGSKYGGPVPQRNFSNTPLGLADIRPRTDSSMSDSAGGNLGQSLPGTQPGPSNYPAPWAVYAFDWCKWPPQGNGSGKVAIGSYLEDGHNFVGSLCASVAHFLRAPNFYRSKSSTAR